MINKQSKPIPVNTTLQKTDTIVPTDISTAEELQRKFPTTPRAGSWLNDTKPSIFAIFNKTLHSTSAIRPPVEEDSIFQMDF